MSKIRLNSSSVPLKTQWRQRPPGCSLPNFAYQPLKVGYLWKIGVNSILSVSLILIPQLPTLYPFDKLRAGTKPPELKVFRRFLVVLYCSDYATTLELLTGYIFQIIYRLGQTIISSTYGTILKPVFYKILSFTSTISEFKPMW